MGLVQPQTKPERFQRADSDERPRYPIWDVDLEDATTSGALVLISSLRIVGTRNDERSATRQIHGRAFDTIRNICEMDAALVVNPKGREVPFTAVQLASVSRSCSSLESAQIRAEYPERWKNSNGSGRHKIFVIDTF